MQTLLKATFLIITGLSFATYGLASEDSEQNSKRRGPPAFSVVDINADGILELNEFEQHKLPKSRHEKLFNRIDANQDGQITEEEWANHKPKRKHKNKQED